MVDQEENESNSNELSEIETTESVSCFLRAPSTKRVCPYARPSACHIFYKYVKYMSYEFVSLVE